MCKIRRLTPKSTYINTISQAFLRDYIQPVGSPFMSFHDVQGPLVCHYTFRKESSQMRLYSGALSLGIQASVAITKGPSKHEGHTAWKGRRRPTARGLGWCVEN
ncbi:rCG61947 [Rattus norvegicus]|uniref:RCG61947 n=1 Tax=Rattus norvegicus TaxID=10116 RepID=A6HB85_RAT|nr:rCG61947 [Rattus norvegicus]